MINIHFSKDDYDDSDIGYTRYELVSLEFFFFVFVTGLHFVRSNIRNDLPFQLLT
jgi:hypothetical protein